MDSQQQAAAAASIPEYNYRPLDEARNEIRVLSLSGMGEDDNENPGRGLVHAEMHHVSLDAHLPDFSAFNANVAPRPLSRRGTDEEWRRFSDQSRRDTENAGPQPPARSHPRYHRFTWGDYGALSYTWGDQSDKVPIILDGHVVCVGRNLEAALRALCTDPDYMDGLRLWVDAICINQRDLDERSKQVKRMGDIFGGSLMMTIWLGTATGNDDQPLPDDVQSGLDMLVEAVEHSSDEGAARVQLNLLLDNPAKRAPALDAIELVVQKTYWSRVWVIQEKCLGPYNPVVVLGRFRFALMRLHLLLAYANSVSGATRDREKVWRILKLVELVVANQERLGSSVLPAEASLQQVAERRRRDLDDIGLLLMLGRLAGCQDERDKLYGLMGMMPKCVSRHIVPDYGAPVPRVFADFARALIHGFDSLDLVVTGATDTPLGARLASWVPDLTDTWDMYLWGTSCAASGDRSPVVRIEGANGEILIAAGFEVDVVDAAGPHLGWGPGGLEVWIPGDQETSDAPMPSDPRAAIARTLYRDAQYDVSTHTSVIDIPWLTSLDGAVEARIGAMLAKGWGPVLNHASIVDLHLLRTRLDEQFRPWSLRFRSFFPGGSEGTDWEVPECTDPEGFVRALDKHVGIVYPVMTTNRGRFGASIKRARKGDRIFVLLGCSAPVLVRPTTVKDGKEADVEAFSVVSQCYVEGVMKGQALRQLGDREAKIGDIRLV
ncbi:hypothetical protein PFICI_03980 [Pestalotiopsis fici W106-1]|uniref:Heterokaryon incompatibility domain-containing protein n=1 Tax=Pestalotiopsis fici (strain W106-1 / CGMCC3.15140) TaxID=1229662 RepID=W3XIV9_PESFW|nr:uncharacterized protein PFICI_03980 [Pestalotiopsis fici W106-1]ETS85955.1 hypothetical protein PFICI_03980 [Pestalotiopsis fici W106-1]